MTNKRWIGPAGSLVPLPGVAQGARSAWSIQSNVHETLSGLVRIDRTDRGNRTYELSWELLTQEELSLVERVYHGALGVLPYILTDPSRRNILTSWVSNCADSESFTLTVGASIAGNEITINVGASAPIGSEYAETTLPTPVVVGESYTARVDVDASTPAVVELRFVDSSDTLLSTGTGVPVSGVGTATVTSVAPAGSAYVRLRVSHSASPASAEVITASLPQVDQSVTVREWTLGAGVSRVVPVDDIGYQVDRLPWIRSTSLTLREVSGAF